MGENFTSARHHRPISLLMLKVPSVVVQPSETNVCFLLKDITRKVVLYPYGPGQFAVIDYA